ncbi:short-chain dehydrogenase [Diaporthe amygdali]|uniref:short-chain dehydrogenase n=1 Tax=Phomopsis amygdali TaxID=1214568 RepID=UPI0022FE2D65|nr:short-chain dehydrogenase [Diaporthe amygdali]KAJ0122760.1 short-chain dehydrogenase [Diaporthe amygdali]
MATPRIHEGKLAIVTGAARSIGAAIATNLAAKGAHVLIGYLTEASDKPAAELAQELTSKHNVIAVPCRADISTPEGVKTLIETCKEKFPANSKTGKLQIDIIINSAAVMPTGPVEAVTPEEFHKTYATNVLAPILLVGQAKPYLPTDRSGRIVNISSIGQKCGLPYLTLYSGTKGALEAMTRTWARELAEQCTVNTINPGSVLTDMFRNCSEDVLAAQALWSPVIPLSGAREWDTDEVKAIAKRWGGRPAYVEEIAGVVAIVCNPESGWMTGSVVSANGGQCFST